MYNEVNTSNRQLHRVCGVVLGFTTSKLVEFVNDDLTTSIPVFVPNFTVGDNQGISFLVEAKGFLSFDVGSQVKLLEVGDFNRFEFSATSFFLAEPADEDIPLVSGHSLSDAGPDGYVRTGTIYYTGRDKVQRSINLRTKGIFIDDAGWREVFRYGEPFKVAVGFVEDTPI